jgi:hypothetical protein
MGHHRAAATANLSCVFLVVVALGAIGTGAMAQTSTPTPRTPASPLPATPAPAPVAPAPVVPAPQVTPEVLPDHAVEGVLGKEVVSATNENMGRIVDVLVDHSGNVRAAVIDFGGFLGVGSRKIAVDWGALHVPPLGKPNMHISLEFTRDQVKAAPEYQDGKPVVVLSAPSISVAAGHAQNDQSSPAPITSRPEYETYWPNAEQEAEIPYHPCEIATGWKDRRLICWSAESRVQLRIAHRKMKY